MIGIDLNIVAHFERVEKAAQDATFKNVGHAAAAIRKDAIASIQPSDGPSRPGKPPHTHGSKKKSGGRGKGKLPRAILFAQTASLAVVGPAASITGTVGAAHEFGGQYKSQDFPQRPFMSPALERQRDRFAASFGGSIGS